MLEKLNKRMTLRDYEQATRAVLDMGGSVRSFILLRPPFMSESEGVEWCGKSVRFAFDIGVECCAIIPTRGGNGALESLAKEGLFQPPTLASLEDVFDDALSLRKGRVFVDL